MKVFGLSKTQHGTPVDATARVREVTIHIPRCGANRGFRCDSLCGSRIAERNADGRHPIG